MQGLSALPASNVVPSPSVPHTAARVIFLKLECDHNTPLLKTLHWLPISLRMESLKIASCSGSCLQLQSHLPSVSPPPTARFYPTAHIFHPPLVPELFAVFHMHLILSLSSLGLCTSCPLQLMSSLVSPQPHGDPCVIDIPPPRGVPTATCPTNTSFSIWTLFKHSG